ncbi:purine-cytosine permease family protein [Sulfoacidibacillus thermotolerans]|uniref:Allantoin permease n=1 Tax=Sulfoacidibacillus thermotolerans TaxID=1765684 RepID=A0A2U3DA60_SULT2|nr:cytosine permease [Sulfoacidibacillus thermotolerans]PWI58161.1 hypothetical protein BM613_04275 [Sulfoacidibacillus thermotolerans]
MQIQGNERWKIEQYGIDPIPYHARQDRPMDLFWVWFAANIGILGILYGGVIIGYHLSFLQSLLAAFIGAASFLIVGILSVAGKQRHAPMFILSQSVFGARGNLFPATVGWVNLLGWEAVTVVTGTLSLAALLQDIFVRANPTYLDLFAVTLFSACVIVLGLLGQATLLLVQKVATFVFGSLILIVMLFLLQHGIPWKSLLEMPTGNWLQGFLPAVATIAAGTSISWGLVAADYSRYQASHVRSRTLVLAVTLGGSIPLFILMTIGIILCARDPQLVMSSNPIAAIGSLLPQWMVIPYLLAAVGGLIAEADLSLYSSGLTLLAIGVPFKRYKTIWIDAAVMLGVTIYILFFKQNFLGPFTSFLTFTGISLAAWEAVFITDQWLVRREDPDVLRIDGTLKKQNPSFFRTLHRYAFISWLAGLIIGSLFTTSTFFQGPFANGVFATSSLGILITALVSGSFYFLLLVIQRGNWGR